MKKGQQLWTREELILAINLYCKLPFGKMHRNNPEVIWLANFIGRSSNAVAYKLVNFASLDPSLKERGIKGASNISKADKEIWSEFFNNLDNLAYESEQIISKIKGKESFSSENNFFFKTSLLGLSRKGSAKIRINQSFFRQMVLSSYNYTCCVTGIQEPSLLIAGHIRPWSLDIQNRLNPRNGLSMNSLHDKAFEEGLITITPDYKIKLSPQIFKQGGNLGIINYFLKYENQEIILPNKFLPDPKFLEYHNKERFKLS